MKGNGNPQSGPISKTRRRWISCIAIFALAALAVRVGLVFEKPDFSFPDESWYLEIAQNLAEDHAYRMDKEGRPFALRQSPGLPFALALSGQFAPLTALHAKLVNAVISWIAVLLYAVSAYLVTRRYEAALAALLLIGFHPPLVYLATTNYPNSFQGFWLAVSLCCLCFGRFRWPDLYARPGWGLIDGLILGAGALFVPTQLFLLPAFFVARLAAGLGKPIGYGLFLGVGFGLMCVPWTLRNLVVEERVLPFSTSGGEQMYLGFNESAGMNTGVMVGGNEQLEEELRHAGSAFEVQDIYKRHALKWIEENPGRAAGLWVLKGLNFFRWDTGTLFVRAEEGSAMRKWIMRLTSLFVFALGLTGMVRLWKTDRFWPVLVAGALLLLAAGHAFFLFRYRYRLPFEPLIIFVGLIGLFPGGRTSDRWGAPREADST